MSPGQWAVVAALFAFALIGIPAYALGWWNGRRCLRLTLDPRMLRPVEHPERRAPEPDTRPMLPVAGRFPVDPEQLLLVSDLDAAGAGLVRDVDRWVSDAEALIPARWR